MVKIDSDRKIARIIWAAINLLGSIIFCGFMIFVQIIFSQQLIKDAYNIEGYIISVIELLLITIIPLLSSTINMIKECCDSTLFENALGEIKLFLTSIVVATNLILLSQLLFTNCIDNADGLVLITSICYFMFVPIFTSWIESSFAIFDFIAVVKIRSTYFTRKWKTKQIVVIIFTFLITLLFIFIQIWYPELFELRYFLYNFGTVSTILLFYQSIMYINQLFMKRYSKKIKEDED